MENYTEYSRNNYKGFSWEVIKNDINKFMNKLDFDRVYNDFNDFKQQLQASERFNEYLSQNYWRYSNQKTDNKLKPINNIELYFDLAGFDADTLFWYEHIDYLNGYSSVIRSQFYRSPLSYALPSMEINIVQSGSTAFYESDFDRHCILLPLVGDAEIEVEGNGGTIKEGSNIIIPRDETFSIIGTFNGIIIRLEPEDVEYLK